MSARWLAVWILIAAACAPAAAAPGGAGVRDSGDGVDPRTFDHDATKMPLVGAHRSVACARCHPESPGIWRVALTSPAACNARGCHDDPHGDSVFGKLACELCHSPSLASMRQISFDHDARVPIGTHDQLACDRCHRGPSAAGTPAAAAAPQTDVACERCHGAQSPHGARFTALGTPARCGACHGWIRWTTPLTFDHRKVSRPLRHTSVACRGCHRGSKPDEFEDLHDQATCKGCHAHRTVHADTDHPQGKYTTDQCLNCHFAINLREPWTPRSLLEQIHGRAGTFPLVGGHRDVACKDCHTATSANGKTRFDGMSSECGPACHADRLHRGSLGGACTACHVPQTWAATKLDHQAPFVGERPGGAVEFPLRGRHAELSCIACHPDRDFAAAGTTCASAGCHAGDDAHAGALGAACERCHTDSGALVFDHATSRWPLDGKHRAVPCRDCHVSGRFQATPRRCAACHPVPAFHRRARTDHAWYDDDCGGCHATRAW